MRWMVLLSLGLSLLGCGSKAPAVTWCVIYAPLSEDPQCFCEDPNGKQYEMPIQKCDKFIAQPPQDAQKVRDYVLALERKAANCKN